VLFGLMAFAGPQKDDPSRPRSFKLHFAPRVAVAPKVDGKLDDACWRTVDAITDFGQCTVIGPGKRRIPETSVRVAWDDKYLYVAAKCREDSPENFEAFKQVMSSSSRAFHDRDGIELHIDGNNDEHTTFVCWLTPCAEMNAHWHWDFGWGLLNDANYGLNADWEKAYAIGKDEQGDFYTVEARLALAHFELAPKVGKIFGFEPCRFRMNKTLYRPDGSVLAKNAGMWLGWGSQGKSHHQPQGYAKIVLVESKPASVEAGLRLAYPDLDRRTILVQTGSEYAVFERGKSSTLPYAEKAKSLMDETRQLAQRYEKFASEVSNVVWKTSEWQMKQTAKTLAEFHNLDIRDGDVASTLTAARIGELEKKTSAWNAAFDSAYWSLVRDAMMIERRVRVPVTLKPAADAPELNTEYKDNVFQPWERTKNIVEWAKPSAAGKRRAFITVRATGGIDAWQLAKRMDIDATIYQVTGEGDALGPDSDYFGENLWYAPKKRQELERALKEKGPFDAYVFIGTRIQTWPAELQCWLLERTLEGAKVIVKNGGGPLMAPLRPYSELSAGSPRGFTKMVRDRSLGYLGYRFEDAKIERDPLRLMPFGKGVYAHVDTDVTAAYCHTSHVAPAWPAMPEDAFQDEYGFAYFVRNVMQVIGQRGDRRALDLEEGRGEIAAEAPGSVALRVAGSATWTGTIGWKVRGRDGTVLQEQEAEFTVPSGTSHVSLAIDPLPAGDYYVDATLYASDGASGPPGGRPLPTAVDSVVGRDLRARRSVLDFVSCKLTAAQPAKLLACGCSPNCKKLLDNPKIVDFKLAAKTLYRMAEPVKATVKVSPVAKELIVRAEIRDVRNRVIVRKDFPVDANDGVARIELANVPEYDWTVAHLDVSVRSPTRQFDRKSEPFFRHRGDVSDYQIFTDPPAQGGLNGIIRYSEVLNSGIDLIHYEYYSPHGLFYGADPVAHVRLDGHSGGADRGGSIANPYFLAYLKRRYGKIAADLKEKNGRFISLGDDSSAPRDFGESTPDWIVGWVDWQQDRFREEARQCERQGEKNALEKTVGAWWKSHGINIPGCDDFDSTWGINNPMVRNAVKIMQAAKTPEEARQYAAFFKGAYGTVPRFNRAAGAKIAKWEDVTPELLQQLVFDPSPDFVRFLFWLEDKYGTAEKLNAVWKTDVKSILDLPRETIDAQRAKGVLAPSIDKQAYLEWAFAQQGKALREAIDRQDPSIGVGFGGSWHDNALIPGLKYLDTVCPYEGGMEIEIMRGQKHRYVGEVLGVFGGRLTPVAMRKKQVWHGLLTGCNFGWFWPTFYSAGDGSVDPGRFGALFEAYREIKRGPAALLVRSKRENFGIRVMVSTPSGHLSPYVAEMSTHEQAREVMSKVIESLGYQWDSITDEQVAKGELVKSGAKLLILPYVQVMSPAEAEQIRAFVQAGGTVLADARTATYDEHGVPLAKPLLGDVFGVSIGPKAVVKTQNVLVGADLRAARSDTGGAAGVRALPSVKVDAGVKATTAHALGNSTDGAVAFFVNECGKGRAILLNFNAAVIPFLEGRGELSGVRDALLALVEPAVGKAPATLREAATGKPITGVEFSRFTRKGEIYIGVEKVGYGFETFPKEASVQLDRPYWVYDVRAGKKVGFTDRIPMSLTGLDIGLYSLLPEEAKAIELEVPASVKPGEALKVTATLTVSNNQTIKQSNNSSTRVFRWELVPEGGYDRENFLPYPWRLKDAPGGKATTEWAIDFNAKPGTQWTVVVTDVATGVSASKVVTVR